MHWYLSQSLGMRLSLACAGVSALLVVFLVSLATATSPRNSLVDQSGTIIVDQLAEGAAGYIVEQDNLALQALLSQLTSKPLIAFASIADADHKILVESGSGAFYPKTMRRFSTTVRLHDSVVGYVEMYIAGAASPAMSAVLVLILGVLVFSLVLLFVLLRLKALDQALQRMSRTLGNVLPGESPGEPVKSVADIHGVCEAMQQLVPLPMPEAARKRAVLALRLPQLADDRLDPQQLAAQRARVEQVAKSWQGTIRDCADGWQLLFTTGSDTALRVLAGACFLQQALDPATDYAMAVNLEADAAGEQDSTLRGFNWQRLCDNAHQAATVDNAVMLTRLALCDNGVNQRVTVEQDESGEYRITGFGEEVACLVGERVSTKKPAVLAESGLSVAS